MSRNAGAPAKDATCSRKKDKENMKSNESGGERAGAKHPPGKMKGGGGHPGPKGEEVDSAADDKEKLPHPMLKIVSGVCSYLGR